MKVPAKKRSIGSVVRAFGYGASLVFRRPYSKFSVPDVGLKFWVRTASTFAWKLCKYRSYEPRMSNWLLQNLRVPNGSVIIDVGANFGWYSCILAKKFPTAELYAFEPEADAFTMLGKNVSENNLPNVRMFKHALGSSSGILKLYVSGSENTGTHSAVRLENSSHMVEVDVVPLDHVISAEEVALMKIDAEGSEYSILLGAESTLRRTRVVMLEFTPNLLVRMGVEPRALLDLMISAGFAIGVVDSLGKLVTETAEGLLEDAATQPLWQKDLIFFRA